MVRLSVHRPPRLRRSLLSLAVVGSSSILGISMASAQDGYAAIDMTGMLTYSQGGAMREAAKSVSQQVADPIGRTSTVGDQLSRLSFIPSRSRRQANYSRFVEQGRRADPAGAAALAETLKHDPIAMMEPGLATYGLRTDSVADAYAVY